MFAKTVHANHTHSVYLPDPNTESEVNDSIRQFNESCLLTDPLSTDVNTVAVLIKNLKNKIAPGIE